MISSASEEANRSRVSVMVRGDWGRMGATLTFWPISRLGCYDDLKCNGAHDVIGSPCSVRANRQEAYFFLAGFLPLFIRAMIR